MAEEMRASESAVEASGIGADPAAVTLALGSASLKEADSFLRKQGALIDEQRHHLHVQLRPAIWEKWLGVLLRAATVCVGLAVASGFGFMVWQAAHSEGLKVEAFNVPPAMAERGLTGEVVAARVIDRLSELDAQTNTGRPARSYTNAWGGEAIKLEIPETGVSLAELDSWLREKFGHETSLTGEVVRTQTGVILTARAGDDGAVSVSGSETDMDALTGKAAEAAEGNNDLGFKMFQQALAADPDSTRPYTNLMIDYVLFGRVEEAVQAGKKALAKGLSGTAGILDRADLDMMTGDYHDALPVYVEFVRTGAPGFPLGGLLNRVIAGQIGEHDLAAARVTLVDFPQSADVNFSMDARYFPLQIEIGTGNWRRALGHEGDMTAYMRAYPHNRHSVLAGFLPSLALAHARLGDFTAAERAIAPTPGDCYPCLIARARIAELAGRRVRAQYWFNRATAAGPSLPFAFGVKGRALLDRGLPDQAIARFTIANQKSPHFADPLEGWGEALMAKNRSHRALAKFAEAEKYAPDWGRLHLKWGEALRYSGNKDEAKAQFARATQLDLSPPDKAELAGVSAHG
jgi:tetratricopeptide (TPR) repeat protein